MTLLEIFKKGNLSVRSYNACRGNEIENIDELLEYYNQYKSFHRLKNCGLKSNIELCKLCEKLKTEILESTDYNNSFKHNIEIGSITREQRSLINSYILFLTNNLSNRSKNALSEFLNNNFKIQNIVNRLIKDTSLDIRSINNVGHKSITEIDNYIENIKDFIIEVSRKNSNEEINHLLNSYLLKNLFKEDIITENIINSNSIFILVHRLLVEKILFNEHQTYIILNSLKIFTNSRPKTLSKIAPELKLTRERVRQILKKSLDELDEKLEFIKNFNEDLLDKYNIDLNSQQIELNEELVDLINERNKTYFSREFITYILHRYLSNKYDLVGDKEDVLLSKRSNSRDRHNWKRFYLIDNKILKEIDIEALLNDIHYRLNDRIEETYSFHYKSYLSKFLKKDNISILETVFAIGENIINEEFELYLDLDENITFNRNTTKQVYEYAYEALDQLDRPSKVIEIYNKVMQLHPNYETDEAKIRSAMKRKDGFVPVGRRSIFGLKKWEDKRENFKGGTIREITRDYLSSKQEPIHIHELTNHISKYRPKTYSRSILDNLKADESGEFIFLKQSFIGLSSKNNTYNLKKYESLPSQLGKKIISLDKKGNSTSEIIYFLEDTYKLDENESFNIINNLKYFQ